MKQNIKVSGEVELSQTEVQEALLEQAKTDKKILIGALDFYLSKSHGYSVKRIATSTNPNGEIVVKAEVSSNPSGTPTLFKPEREEKEAPKNFVRKNVGFYKELVSYLEDEGRKGRKEIPFDEALEDLTFLFPNLTRRKFLIYCSDKRQQKMKGYRYDTKKKVLGATRI